MRNLKLGGHVRSPLISDTYVQRLVTDCQLVKLQKILFVVPGLNSLPGILNLAKLGNILSWTVASEEVAEVESIILDMNYDLDIVNRKMTMR